MTSVTEAPGDSVPCAGEVTMAIPLSGEPQLAVSTSAAPRAILKGSQLRTLVYVALAAVGASLLPLMLMANVQGAEVSCPPLAVPPLSLATTVTLATPHALGA